MLAGSTSSTSADKGVLPRIATANRLNALYTVAGVPLSALGSSVSMTSLSLQSSAATATRSAAKHGRPTSGSGSSNDTLGRSDLSQLQRQFIAVNEASVATVLPSALPALFFDCTHDNVTPAQKRHAVDALATAVVVAASVCPGGSNRGFDILVPENINVVTDHRLYTPVASTDL